MHTNLVLEQKSISSSGFYRRRRAKVSHCSIIIIGDGKVSLREKKCCEKFSFHAQTTRRKTWKFQTLLICYFFTFKENFSLFTRNLVTLFWTTKETLYISLVTKNWRKKNYENYVESLKAPSRQSTALRIFHKIHFHLVFIRRDVSEMENFSAM